MLTRGKFEIGYFCLHVLAILIQYFKRKNTYPYYWAWTFATISIVSSILTCLDFDIRLSGECLRGRSCLDVEKRQGKMLGEINAGLVFAVG